MGNLCINFGGGGGITSDDVTTTRDTVLAGFKTLMTDSNDEPVEGAIPVYSGNVKAEQVYLDDNKVTFGTPYGYSRFNNSSNDMRSYKTYGELAAAIGLTSNKVAVNNSILGIAGTYKGLGNVTAAQVLSGYTFSSSSISNGTGTLSISSVVSFRVAQYSSYTVIASWANPSKGPWSGLRVICKQGGYPSNVNDGTLFYEGSGTSRTVTLAGGTWYFRAWNYITTNFGRMYGGYVDGGSINNVIVHGQQVFTFSGTFTIPTGITSIDLFGVGGGGGGNTYQSSGDTASAGGGGGGSGYTATVSGLSVSAGQVLSINIGAGGAGGVTTNRKPWEIARGKDGGNTTISRNGTVLLTAKGGIASDSPYFGQYIYGGSGGSGGGMASNYPRQCDGGSDGNDCGPNHNHNNGYGQHTTTRAFGESSNTLYAGGGGAGNWDGSYGKGGAGGGGNGGDWTNDVTSSGTAGTGGGGGGVCERHWHDAGAGGSGIVIIRW